MRVLDLIRPREPAAGGAPPRAGGCLRCGRCCESFGGHLHVSKADLERWTRLGRDDLLRRVGPVSGWIWLDPQTGLLEESCPFLERTGPDTAICSIHEVKPDICRDFPTLAHGRRCLRGGFLAWGALAVWGEAAALLAGVVA
jgi:Fe-S-cluster containining protein